MGASDQNPLSGRFELAGLDRWRFSASARISGDPVNCAGVFKQIDFVMKGGVVYRQP